MKTLKASALLASLILLASCRGQRFENQPVHPVMDMDQQNRFEAQEENSFFADNRAMRMPVEGTVARGTLRENSAYYRGTGADGEYIAENPVEVTKSFLYRGQKQYEVYCTPCHGKVGDGQGIIMTGQYGFVPAPSFHQDRLRDVEDGYIYATIADGIRNMPGYAHQIKVEDRWAIVAYLRALQRSQNATQQDLQQYNVDLSGMESAFAEQQAAEEARQAEEAASGGGDVSVELGEKLYISNGCQACHSRDGSDGIGPTHLNIAGSERELTDGTTVTADDEYLRESIVEPNAKIVAGYQPIMAPYSFLSDSEVQSLVEYMKSLSDN